MTNCLIGGILSLMDVALLVVQSLILCCLLGFFYALLRLSLTIRQFISPVAENKPSPLGQFIQSVAAVFAIQVTQSVHGALMGTKSAISKAGAALEGDLIADAVSQKLPFLGLAMETVAPRTLSRLMRSPAAQAALGLLLKSKLTGEVPGNNHQSAPESLEESQLSLEV